MRDKISNHLQCMLAKRMLEHLSSGLLDVGQIVTEMYYYTVINGHL